MPLTTAPLTTHEAHAEKSDREIFAFAVASSLTIALLNWVGTTVNTNQLQISKLQVEVAQLSRHNLRDDTNDRELKREFKKRVKELKVLENKVAVLESLGYETHR